MAFSAPEPIPPSIWTLPTVLPRAHKQALNRLDFHCPAVEKRAVAASSSPARTPVRNSNLGSFGAIRFVGWVVGHWTAIIETPENIGVFGVGGVFRWAKKGAKLAVPQVRVVDRLAPQAATQYELGTTLHPHGHPLCQMVRTAVHRPSVPVSGSRLP